MSDPTSREYCEIALQPHGHPSHVRVDLAASRLRAFPPFNAQTPTPISRVTVALKMQRDENALTDVVAALVEKEKLLVAQLEKMGEEKGEEGENDLLWPVPECTVVSLAIGSLHTMFLFALSRCRKSVGHGERRKLHSLYRSVASRVATVGRGTGCGPGLAAV